MRERAGLFDLSHMGELYVEGPEAGPALAASLVSDPPEPRRRARPLLDDLRARTAASSTTSSSIGWARRGSWSSRTPRNAAVVSRCAGGATPRLQGDPRRSVAGDRRCWRSRGPRAAEVLRPLLDVDLGALRLLRRRRGDASPGSPALIARTGYTGEDGFELFVDWASATEASGRCCSAPCAPPAGCPVGLGARDTLRLEAGMPLYGNELDLATNPFEAGLGRVVKLDKPGRLRRASGAREGRRATALPRQLVGLIVEGRGIARHGYPVWSRGAADRGRDQRHPVADARRRRSRWHTSHPATPSRVP